MISIWNVVTTFQVDLNFKEKRAINLTCIQNFPQREMEKKQQHSFIFSLGVFFWDYSGIGILGIDGICVLLEAIPFSE